MCYNRDAVCVTTETRCVLQQRRGVCYNRDAVCVTTETRCVQYASFQDKHHLYFLFDLLPGGDLMDILVAEARVVKHRTSDGPLNMACLAPKTNILKECSQVPWQPISVTYLAPGIKYRGSSTTWPALHQVSRL